MPYTEENLNKILAIRGIGEKTWPYWLEEWPASYAMAEILEEIDFNLNQNLDQNDTNLPLSSARVLDLGSGSGFLAGFLKQRFDFNVFSCDFNFDACHLTRHNASINLPFEHSASRTFCADFTAFPMRKTFEFIFAGEMLYHPSLIDPILDFLKRFLSASGKAFLADRGRSSAAGFFDRAEKNGLQIKLFTKGNFHVYQVQKIS